MRDESEEINRERGMKRTRNDRELWRWGKGEKGILQGR